MFLDINGVSMDLTVSNDDGDSFDRVIWGSVPAGQWTTLSFGFDEFDPGGHPVHRFNIREISGADSVVYYVDNIRLIGADTTEAVDWDAEPATFTYDANGNLKSQSGKIDNIQYDHRNLPVKFTMSDGQQEVVAGYNADGQRILKESSGGAYSFYVNDGQQTLAVISYGSQQDTTLHFNLFGNSLFGRYEPGGTRRYYVTDHLGSTRAVVDDGGTVLETFDYYPFGLLMPGRNGGANATLEKFTGKERDDEGGLNLDYFGARYYDAALGRWHSADPLADDFPGWSPYNYTLNNPINLLDPDGRSPCPPQFLLQCLEISFDTFLASRGMRQTEIEAVKKTPWNFIGAYTIYRNGNRESALRAAQESGLPGIENGPADAFRHALFSALNTRDAGPATASELGSAHEEDRPNQPEIVKEMDLHNNVVGVGVALENSNGTLSDFSNAILSRMQKGDLKFILNGEVVNTSISDYQKNQVMQAIRDLEKINKEDDKYDY